MRRAMLDLRQRMYKASRRGWRKHKFVLLALSALALFIGYGVARNYGLWTEGKSLYENYRSGIMDALGVGAFGLAIAAAFALYSLQRSMSTRFIGEFPDHLDRITTLIHSAVVRIDALADCVDYGSFFRPEAYDALRRAIREAHETRGLPVRILVCGEVHAICAASAWCRRSFQDQYADADFADRLKHYCEVIQREQTGFMKFL